MKPTERLEQNDSLKILVVYNPMSNGGKSLENFNDYLSFLEKNKALFITYFTNENSDQKNLEEIIQTEKITHISICGGDGTLNMVINCELDEKVLLHLIPLGSGNDFANSLYGFLKPQDAFDLIFKKSQHKIDCWKCNDRRFINMFGCGFDGKVAYRTFQNKGFLPSHFKYWFEIIHNIICYQSNEILVNDKSGFLFMLAAGNGKTVGGNFKVAPEAELNDGLLDLIWVKKVNFLQRIINLLKIKKGKHLGKSFIHFEKTTKIVISSQKTMYAHLDGEPMKDKHFNITYFRPFTFLSK